MDLHQYLKSVFCILLLNYRRIGSLGRIWTFEWRSQSPLPYRLATRLKILPFYKLTSFTFTKTEIIFLIRWAFTWIWCWWMSTSIGNPSIAFSIRVICVITCWTTVITTLNRILFAKHINPHLFVVADAEGFEPPLDFRPAYGFQDRDNTILPCIQKMVWVVGVEPTTSCLQNRNSKPSWATPRYSRD